MRPKPNVYNCIHFTHPTAEQFQLLDILSYNNLQSVLFELIHYLIRADRS